MYKWILKILTASFFVSALSFPAFAEFPKNWYTEGIGDFLQGEALSTAINADGSLGISSDIIPVFQSRYGNFLDAVLTPDEKEMYLGTANAGHVVHLDSKGQVTSVFQRQKSMFSAIAVDSQKRVYAAASPDGQIFQSNEKGKFLPFVALEERYIWDMLIQGSQLYVATGDKGAVYRVNGRQPELYFEGGDAHIKTLYHDDKVGLLAGSGDKGIVYHLTGKGQANALLESSLPDITSIIGDGKGNIYVSAVAGEKGQGKTKGAVYWIAPNERVDILFQSEADMFHSLVLDKNGDLLIGSGPRGHIYKIASPSKPETRRISLVGRSRSKQVVKLLPRFNDTVIVGSNTPQVELVKAGYRQTGIYLSDVLATDLLSRWGNLSYNGLTPTGTKIEVRSRSGNTQKPDTTWSSWSNSYPNASGINISSPPGRYLQLEFKLNTNNSNITPLLYSFNVSYLRRNLPPRIRDAYFLEKGLFFRPHPPIPQPSARAIQITPELLKKMQHSQSTDSLYKAIVTEDQAEDINRVIQDSRPGMLTLAWDATDRNDDELLYDIYYRSYGSQQWLMLAKELRQYLYSFDSLSLVDGQYHFRVYASDELSNPGEQSHRIWRDTDLITIDNTPPKIQSLNVRTGQGGATVSFSLQDQVSSLAIVQYALDGKDFKIVQSKDGIVDSLREDIEIKLSHLAKGSHLIVVKGIDRVGNIAVGHQNFEIR